MQKKGESFVCKVLDSSNHANYSSPKAVVLGLAQQTIPAMCPDMVEKVPQVKILNLSKSEVRKGIQMTFQLKAGGSAH
jgi:hypothetical protein